MADDGGSSGRLRQIYDVPAPGDLRKCLVALADADTVWREAFEHRFRGGDLDGHALGNLIIVGLTQVLGDFGRALEEAGRLLDCAGRVLPATTDPVVLTADAGDGGPESPCVEGQVAVSNTMDPIRRVHIVPEDAKAHPEVVSAIELADQVILAPGSLFTSLAPVLCVPAIREALAATRGRIVHVCNLQPQVPETLGLDATDHLRAVLDHGARVDAFLYHLGGELAADEIADPGPRRRAGGRRRGRARWPRPRPGRPCQGARRALVGSPGGPPSPPVRGGRPASRWRCMSHPRRED